MVRTMTLILTIAVAGGTSVQPQGSGAAAVDLQGKLYRSVFSSGSGVLAPADVKALPEPLRGRLDTYLARRAAFRSNYKSEADSFEQVRVDAKRRLLEQAIVSLIDVPGIEKRAADYVATAPINYEWKGLQDGPLEEANHAEAILAKDRVAFETFAMQKNDEGMKAAAKKYRTFADRAMAADDPIYAALIADMERQPYLYMKGAPNPRDYAIANR